MGSEMCIRDRNSFTRIYSHSQHKSMFSYVKLAEKSISGLKSGQFVSFVVDISHFYDLVIIFLTRKYQKLAITFEEGKI